MLSQNVFKFLIASAASKSLPLSLLLIGMEELVEENFLCPCSPSINKRLMASIFIGPLLFTFALMYILLRPFKRRYSREEDTRRSAGSNEVVDTHRSAGSNEAVNTPLSAGSNASEDTCFFAGPNEPEDTRRSAGSNDARDLKAFSHCLIPSAWWIIVLFLDGDYLACGSTEWEGSYVFDSDLNRKWCQTNDSLLRHDYRVFIGESQFYGYVMLAVFSVLILIIVVIYDHRTPPHQEIQGDHQGEMHDGNQNNCATSGHQHKQQHF
nr:uncharacterized protein LOC129453849 [Misgurnus anguillicaudatus]